MMNNWRKTPWDRWINFDQIKTFEIRYDSFCKETLIVAIFGKVMTEDDDELIITSFPTEEEAEEFLDDFVLKAKANRTNFEN